MKQVTRAISQVKPVLWGSFHQRYSGLAYAPHGIVSESF